MKSFIELKKKPFIPWVLLSFTFVMGYCLLGLYEPFGFILLEKNAAAEAKPPAETKPTSDAKPARETKPAGDIQPPGEAQSAPETKAHGETKKEGAPVEKSEKVVTPADSGNTVDSTTLMQPEDIRAVMETLERKRKMLQEDEARLRKERANLENLKLEIEGKISELTEVQKKIEDDLSHKTAIVAQQEKKIEDAELQKIKQLVKVYSTMKPKSAAAIIDKMDMNVVFQVFSNMKGEQVGEILSFVNQERAAKISEWLVTKEKTK